MDWLKGKEGVIPNSLVPEGEGLIPDSWTGGVPTKQALGNMAANVGFDSKTFNVEDPEEVKKVQRMLGVKDDGIFGKQTEGAYRKFIADKHRIAGDDVYRYDENQAPGGMLGNAWFNMDKALGGWLPGGYDKDKSNVSY